MNQFELMRCQNDKSIEIIHEYEKIANEYKKNNKKEEIELNNKINSKKNTILILNQEKYELISYITLKNIKNINIYEIYNKIYIIDNKILNLEDKLDTMEAYLRKIKSRNIYPYENDIFGFSLLYYDISLKIGIEWKHHIYTWTMLGYKAVYPKYAIDYIQYKKDIETSESLMINIENKLRSENKNIYEIYENLWIDEINNYLKEYKIIIDDNVVFRPRKNSNLINKSDDIKYYRITKIDLINYDKDYDIMDYSFLIDCE